MSNKDFYETNLKNTFIDENLFLHLQKIYIVASFPRKGKMCITPCKRSAARGEGYTPNSRTP